MRWLVFVLSAAAAAGLSGCDQGASSSSTPGLVGDAGTTDGGVVTGTPCGSKVCDDGNPCTADGCVAGLQCVFAAVAAGTVCDDGDKCSQASTCTAGGACVGSDPLACNDGNACTTDGCDPKLGCVSTPAPSGAACSDGDPCTAGESCSGGKCGGGKAQSCDDGKPCTTDGCDAQGCSHTPVAEKPCDGQILGNSCYHVVSGAATSWASAEKACVSWGGHLVAISSKDENDFVRKLVTAAVGYTTNSWIGLSDSLTEGKWRWSTGAELSYSAWTSGEPNNASDEDVVELYPSGTWNDAAATETRTAYTCERPSRDTCTDGNACTVGDACGASGACAAGLAALCDDGNPATTDSCQPAKGCVYTTPTPTAPVDLCSAGAGKAAVQTSDACVKAICAADPYCCKSSWDNKCIQQVASVCKLADCAGLAAASGSCAHSLCAYGAKLVSGCDKAPSGTGCVQQVCAKDAYCCNNEWDGKCVGKISALCGLTCKL